MVRFALTGLVFGFFTEWLLGNGKIYDNIIKKTTLRRLSKAFPMQTRRRKKTTVFRIASSSGSKLPKGPYLSSDTKLAILCSITFLHTSPFSGPKMQGYRFPSPSLPFLV
jgi:hypothetical protein